MTHGADDRVAEVSIPTRGNGNDEESTAALDEIRDEVIPATIGKVDGATVNVSGSAAQFKDFRELVADRLPLIFAFVFMPLSFLDFKEIGLGLAFAVLIDATIVRGVLLPASMRVLGAWNWYLWLEWLPHGEEPSGAAPAAVGARRA